MTKILFVGQKPETVDFSDPSLPPGFDAEKINAGIALGVKKIEEHGWKGDTCMITPDAAGSAMLETALKGADYDCVVIGGGIRLPPKGLALFENRVRCIPQAADDLKTIAREKLAWLDGLIAELEQQKPFLARPGHLVVLDTSALMEGVFFTEFDWHALDPAVKEGPIRLILPSLVIEELDELKRRDARQKAQARKVLRTLRELHRPRPTEPAPLPDRPEVSAEVLLDGGWHQRQPNNDEEIIDQARQAF